MSSKNDIVKDPASKTSCFVFDYINHVDFRSIFSRLTDIEILFYIYVLMKAVDFIILGELCIGILSLEILLRIHRKSY